MKYTRPLLVSIIAIIPMTVLFAVTSNAGWVILLFPVSAIIGTLIGFVLAPIFLWVYKKYMGRNHLFAIQEQHEMEKSHGMFMGFFPAIMATNFALSLIFNPTIMNIALLQDYYLAWNSIIFLFFILGAFLQAPAFALFSAAWIIDESGIVMMSKYGSTDIQAIGKWYLALLKGYAGIGVILALYEFTFDFLDTYGSQVHWSAILFLFILPIIVTFWVIPAIMIVGATHGRRRSFILKYAERFGIRNEFELHISRCGHSPSEAL
ncbi:MAG: hypothetical protein JSW61_14145 [Candidatus Thorarchaeota archaeon]|nr:MAG: hypothetical protein JSW61_14145 [Candidatus Thorarchaeota archaeon]